LLGGRIDIAAGGAAPTLVYKRREHLISVTELRADKGDYPETPERRSLQGYPVVTWSDGQRAYVAISDLAPSELDAFVAAFREAARNEASEPPSSTK
jgi:anti-sigma factor RsiW